MSGGGTTLDHVGFVGRDLDAMRAAMQRLGFAPTEPRTLMGVDRVTGASVSLQQSSAHIVLERGYVELSAVHTDSPAHHLAAYLQRHAGLHILAFGTDDIAAAHARCAQAGLPVTAPAAAAREIAYGQRHGTARFEWFMLEPPAAPEGLVCFARNFTPELVYQPEVQGQPNGARSLEAVYIVARDPVGTARRMAGLCGSEAVQQGGALAVHVEGGEVRVLEPGAYQEHFPGATLPPLPCMAAVSIGVQDLDDTAAVLAVGGARVRAAHGRLWVEQQAAAGAVIEFVP